MEPRYSVNRKTRNGRPTSFHVFEGNNKEWVALSMEEASERTVATIYIGGMVSEQLARVWTTQICDQLNQFDVANATVGKLI